MPLRVLLKITESCLHDTTYYKTISNEKKEHVGKIILQESVRLRVILSQKLDTGFSVTRMGILNLRFYLSFNDQD